MSAAAPLPASVGPAPLGRLAALAGTAVAGLLIAGPLELRDTLAAGPVRLTTTELIAALAATTALAAALVAVRQIPSERKRLSDSRGRAAVLVLVGWALLHLASALWADADRGAVVKSALRIGGQTGMAVLCWWWAAHGVFRQRLVRGALTGLGIITLLAVAERMLGQRMEHVLSQFRDEPTWMLGEQRLATVFYHANTCAGYLEWLSPLLLVGWLAPGQTRWKRWFFGLWALLVAVLLSLTYSRAGLLAGAAGALALAWAGRQMPRGRWWIVGAATWAVVEVGAYALNPEMRARVGLDERSYQPQYVFLDGCAGHAGSKTTVRLQVRNRGTWALSNRQAPAKVTHSFLTVRGHPVDDVWIGQRLPAMPPGSSAELALDLDLPSRPGKYALCVDILRDRVLFLSEVGAPLGWLGCEVVAPGMPLVAGPPAHFQPDDLSAVASTRRMDLERRHYWRAALLLWERKPWLGWGSDRFHLIHREYMPPQTYDSRARAHSLWLETAVDLGLLGLAVLGWTAWILLRAGRLAFRRGWTSDRGTALALTAGLVGVAIHSTVDFFFAYTQFSVIFWPLLGLLLGLTRTSDPSASPAPEPPPPATAGAPSQPAAAAAATEPA